MIRRKSERHHALYSLTPKEYEALLLATGAQEDRVLIMMAVELGLRRADIVRIKRSDVDLENNKLSYHEKKKGDRIRIVPIGSKLTHEIRILLQTLPKTQETLFSFKDRTAYNRLSYLCKIAGIKPIPFHSLRATCVKFKVKAGWDIASISRLIGDKIETVQEYYNVPTDGELAELMREKEGV